MDIRVIPGDKVGVVYFAAGGAPSFLQGYFLYEKPDGGFDEVRIAEPASFTTDGTVVSITSQQEVRPPGGKIVGGSVAGQNSLAPGIFYTALVLDRPGRPDEWLCRGYLTDLVDSIPIGVHEPVQWHAYARDKKYTAGGAVTGTVAFTPAANSPMEIESIMLIIGGVKATPALGLIAKRNPGGTLNLSRWAEDTAIAANELLTVPALGELQDTIASSSIITDTTSSRWIHNPDTLFLNVSTMANLELFTIRIRAKVHGPADPTVTATNVTEANE